MAESTALLRTHPLEAWTEAFADLPDSVGDHRGAVRRDGRRPARP